MKRLRQNILVATFIGLVGFTHAACAGLSPPAPEPQRVVFVTPTQAAAPQAQSTAVIEPVAHLQPEPVETEIEPVVSTTFVEWAPDGPIVENAESTLVRMEHGLYATFRTVGLEPGDAFTLWWVIFNKPENCSDGECGIDDAFLVDENGNEILDDEGSSKPNLTGRAATEMTQLLATGTIVDEDGSAEFRARLSIGDTNDAQFGPGLLGPMAVDVHLIIRTHGPATPGVLHEQLNSPWGGCPEGWPKDPCKNVQIAIHSASPE